MLDKKSTEHNGNLDNGLRICVSNNLYGYLWSTASKQLSIYITEAGKILIPQLLALQFEIVILFMWRARGYHMEYRNKDVRDRKKKGFIKLIRKTIRPRR